MKRYEETGSYIKVSRGHIMIFAEFFQQFRFERKKKKTNAESIYGQIVFDFKGNTYTFDPPGGGSIKLDKPFYLCDAGMSWFLKCYLSTVLEPIRLSSSPRPTSDLTDDDFNLMDTNNSLFVVREATDEEKKRYGKRDRW